MPDNPLEGQPSVKLCHPDLDNRETTQPLSYAKILVEKSGWEPADDAAAELLGVKPRKKERKKSQQQEADASTEKGD